MSSLVFGQGGERSSGEEEYSYLSKSNQATKALLHCVFSHTSIINKIKGGIGMLR